MSSTTFFGEVNELKSRAIYWSDEESDEETEETGDPQPIQTNVSLNLDQKLPEECKTVFVSLSKNDQKCPKSTTAPELTQIGSIIVGESNVSVGHIVGVNKTSIWLRLNANHPNLKNYLLVKTISSLMNQMCSTLKTKPLFVVISKEVMKDNGSDDTMTYLTANKDNLSIIGSQVKSRPLLAPKMLTDLVESSIFEYCTVFGIQCIALLLPELQSNQFKPQFIPKPVLDSIKQFNQFSDSNIYI